MHFSECRASIGEVVTVTPQDPSLQEEPLQQEAPYSVIRVRTSFESTCQAFLVHIGVEAITPQIKFPRPKSWNKKAGTGKEIEVRTAFPGYVFARYSKEQKPDIRNYTPYFIDFLRFGDYEAQVSAEEMRRIRLVLGSSSRAEPRQNLIPGEPVIVVRGCMKGLIGEYVRTGKWEMLIVNLQMFGRAIATPMPREYVEPIQKKDRVSA